MDESVGGYWNDLPVWHPFRVTQICLLLSYLLLVPVAYWKIFYFLKNMMGTGLAERIINKRKKRNIVSSSYNFAVWLADGFAIVMVSTNFNLMGESKPF